MSVRPSVSLSVTRVNCDKTNESSADILIPYERKIHLLFRTQRMVGGGRPCQEMENIVRISLWLGMLRRPSRDSVGGARDPETRGSTARCRVVGRSNPCRCWSRRPDMMDSMGDAISYHYILQCMYVVEVCLTSPFEETASVLERCMACKAFQVAAEVEGIRTIYTTTVVLVSCNLSKVARATLRYQ